MKTFCRSLVFWLCAAPVFAGGQPLPSRCAGLAFAPGLVSQESAARAAAGKKTADLKGEKAASACACIGALMGAEERFSVLEELRALQRGYPPSVSVPVWLWMIGDPSLNRWARARAAGDLCRQAAFTPQDKALLSGLEGVLSGPDSAARGLAASALVFSGRHGAGASREADLVRACAIAPEDASVALFQLGNDERTFSLLLSFSSSTDAGLREGAAQALGKMEHYGPHAIPRLMKMLEDDAPAVASAAAYALTHFEEESAKPLWACVLESCGEPGGKTCARCADALSLSESGPGMAVAFLDANAPLSQRRAAFAVLANATTGFDLSPYAQAIGRALSDTDPAVRSLAEKAFSRLKGE
ncbi:MAG: hypothetical protein GX410_07630 [Elusimicrobia bacterium]|nr:hypothetical protein [Elusimicrobiota bacterium]